MARQSVYLTPQQVLKLETPAGIVDFFGDLNYQVDRTRLHDKDPGILHTLHRTEQLTKKIAGFKQIAVHHDDVNADFFVYLYILTEPRPSKEVRDGIVQDLLRRNSGQYLLLLASDQMSSFTDIEFVFMDRVVGVSEPDIEQPSLFPGVLPAPYISSQKLEIRSLSVDCRHPDQRAIKFLRDLAYNRERVNEHCQAVSRAFDNAETRSEYFNNRSLFSDHYLLERLPFDNVREWQGSEKDGELRDELDEVSPKLRSLLTDMSKKFAHISLQDLRPKLFEPVLQLLGFAWQAPTETDGNEYLLSLPAAPGNTLASCLVYPWEQNLDEYPDSLHQDVVTDNEVRNENPGMAVVSLLAKGQAPWAILTNGRIWRLYSAQARSRATNYYEIDLRDFMSTRRDEAERRLDAFRYFWLFFRADAFYPLLRENQEERLTFLDFVVRESERYARQLGDNLKERIFVDIFPGFAKGFLYYAQQTGKVQADLTTMDPEERRILLHSFFEGTLMFLFRMLVLLYAESRAFLPLNDIRYNEHSLDAMKKELGRIARDAKAHAADNLEAHYKKLDDHGQPATSLYDRLNRLFKAFARGDSELNVPFYGSDLFLLDVDKSKPDAELTPDELVARFLDTHKIPDHYLAPGLDRLAREEETKGAYKDRLVYVDYKSLGVRQLGSIYEGLLEFKLRIAQEQMVVLKGKVVNMQSAIDAGQYTPGKTKAEIYTKNEPYIENDRHERKATGSYYTPDYIVKYIIEKTVGPILQQKFAALEGKFRQFEMEYQNVEKENRQFRANRQKTKNPQTIYNKFRHLIVELFDIKVLDPSMGSGHFLVDAVDYITDHITAFLLRFSQNPVYEALRHIRSTIEAEVSAQGVSIDSAELTELKLLKRQVLKSCIFGVDVNHMAVKLTKASLWLDTFAPGAPLTFLSYHIKWGNSLLGVNLEAVEELLKKSLYTVEMTDIANSASVTRSMGQETDASAETIREMQSIHNQMLQRLQPYKELMNVWVSGYFGNTGAQGLLQVKKGVEAVLKRQYDEIHPNEKKLIEEAQLIAGQVHYAPLVKESKVETSIRDFWSDNASGKTAKKPTARARNFFHWDLEFTEAYFSGNQRLSAQQAGFDAIIGNPPYVRQEGLGEDKVAFKDLYNDVYSSIADLYTYFIVRAHMLLRKGGRFGMITANKFMRAAYGMGLRKYLTTQIKLEELIDFGDLPVFEEATTYPVIIISSKAERNGTPIEYALMKHLKFKSLPEVVEENGRKMPESAFSDKSWSLEEKTGQAILDKLNVNRFPLERYLVGSKIRRGILTGLNEAFIIDKTRRDKLVAEDPKSAEIIKPFLVGEDIRKYMVNYQDRYLIRTYIDVPIERYPAIFKHLQQYQPQLEKRWDKGKRWWELRACDYYADFEKPKIIYPVISSNNKFTLDRDSHFSNDKTFFIPTDDLYLLSILNSSTMYFFFCSELSKLRGGFLEYRAQTLIHIPIRRINYITSKDQRTSCLQKSKLLYQQCTLEDQACVLGFVEHHLAKDPEASDVVRDLLAFLAEEMIRLNKEKQTLQNEFLAYLIKTLKIQTQPDKKTGKVGLDAMKGKGRLLDYAGDYLKNEDAADYEEIKNILIENKRRYLQYPEEALLREIGQVYKQSVAAIEPLKKQLRMTDTLIDEVVYRLYGLTEQERSIVRDNKKS